MNNSGDTGIVHPTYAELSFIYKNLDRFAEHIPTIRNNQKLGSNNEQVMTELIKNSWLIIPDFIKAEAESERQRVEQIINNALGN